MYDYTMDPSGDVVLTLRNPNAPLAIWDSDEPPPIETEPTVEPIAEPIDEPIGEPIVEPIVEPNTVPEPAPPTENGILAENEPPPQDDEAPLQEDPHPVMPPDEPVTFLVSSRHLVLASPVLKAMLTGGWNEGDRNNGQLHICAEDWDAKALAVVMNVLHSHYRQVPKTVTLEMLAKIAVIVDYYKVHEALEIMASVWIKVLQESLPHLLGRDVVLWILVSWVFGDVSIFKQVTKVAILRSRGDVEISQRLPIPPAVIDRINQHRKDSMGVIAAGLHGLRQDYTEGREGCSFQCSAMHLGTLLKNLHGLKLLDHPPETPFGDSNLVEVVEGIGAMESPTWCVPSSICYYGQGNYAAHQCTQIKKKGKKWKIGAELKVGVCEKVPKNITMGTLRQFVYGVKDKIEGLRLADFVPGTHQE